jgi:hypothetical protein
MLELWFQMWIDSASEPGVIHLPGRAEMDGSMGFLAQL